MAFSDSPRRVTNAGVNTPWQIAPGNGYTSCMDYKTLSQDPTQAYIEASRSPTGSVIMQDASLYPPTSEEVAKRAYFCYVNQGSQSGHEMDHWLQAEDQLLRERNFLVVEPSAALG